MNDPSTFFQANVQYKDKEDELSALARRIMLLETESNGADFKLAKTTMEVTISIVKKVFTLTVLRKGKAD